MLLWGTFQKYGEAPKLSLDDMAKVQAITQNYTKRAKSTSRRFKRGERTSYDSNTNTKNVNRHFKIHKNRRLWLQNTHRRRLITQKRAKRTSLDWVFGIIAWPSSCVVSIICIMNEPENILSLNGQKIIIIIILSVLKRENSERFSSGLKV